MASIKKFFLYLFVIIVLPLSFQECKVSYSFTGTSLSPNVKSFSVDYFSNHAGLVNATLSQTFTEALKDKLGKQTSLNLETERGDLEFSGQITGYSTKPINITENDESAQTRLTITVKVKYVNNLDHGEDWDKSFSAYSDYDSSKMLTDVEEELCSEITEDLVDDIFNASIANW